MHAIEDRGYQFADGIYEYFAFYNRILLDEDPHLARLERSLKEIGIKPQPMSSCGAENSHARARSRAMATARMAACIYKVSNT